MTDRTTVLGKDRQLRMHLIMVFNVDYRDGNEVMEVCCFGVLLCLHRRIQNLLRCMTTKLHVQVLYTD